MSADLDLLHDYVAEGDAEAFSSLLRQHQGLVYGTCLRILGNPADAEDAAQECFLKLARHAATIRSSVVGWLHSCATRAALNVLEQRRSRLHREDGYSQLRAARQAEAREPTWQEISPRVDEALERLPEEIRFVVIQRFLEQRSQVEIAEELGISRGVLRRRLDAGIEMIRRDLKKAGLLASVPALAGLLAENAAVAAPPTLGYELGKLAIVGSHLGARPGTAARFPAAPAGPASSGGLAMVAKKVAAVAAALAGTAGLALAVAWLCGLITPGLPGGSRGLDAWPEGYDGAAAPAGPAGRSPGGVGAAVRPGRSGGEARGPAGEGPVGDRPGRVGAGRLGDRAAGSPAGRGAGGGRLAGGERPSGGYVSGDEEREKRRGRAGSAGAGSGPARVGGPGIRAAPKRPGVLYSIFGPSTPAPARGAKDRK